jgi:hypothetical protein
MNESQEPQNQLAPMQDEPMQEEYVNNDVQEEYNDYDYSNDNDVTTYLSWHAPGRPYRVRSSEYYINSFLILAAVEIILFFFSQYLLMLVSFSLAFLAFALAVVPPHMFYYKVSNQGIRVEDSFFIWDELYDFYFMKQHSQDVLHIRTKAYFPGELTISLGDIPTQQIRGVLLNHLPFREYVKPTFTEKAGNWLEKNFPLEKSPSA